MSRIICDHWQHLKTMALKRQRPSHC